MNADTLKALQDSIAVTGMNFMNEYAPLFLAALSALNIWRGLHFKRAFNIAAGIFCGLVAIIITIQHH